MFDRRIAARQPPPTCLLELQRALLDEWCNIPQDQIDNLILNMPRRCRWPTNFEQPTLNHVQSDTMASAVLADPTHALQETNRGSGPAMEESENDVESLEQLLLYADEHYLAGKLILGDHLGKVLHGVEEYHQRNVSPLRFHA
ncbi:15-hydroxyprostaglandin dehydrogenase [Trichonephila clavipes]|nr:15-hydroxyprostaglandin dehydrogenase [Trichonephila clavipes]